MRAAAARTFWTAGSSNPMRMAMMAITTSSSTSVKPRRAGGRVDIREPSWSQLIHHRLTGRSLQGQVNGLPAAGLHLDDERGLAGHGVVNGDRRARRRPLL